MGRFILTWLEILGRGYPWALGKDTKIPFLPFPGSTVFYWLPYLAPVRHHCIYASSPSLLIKLRIHIML